jgi:DNA-binding GntR family transcriptional regulator
MCFLAMTFGRLVTRHRRWDTNLQTALTPMTGTNLIRGLRRQIVEQLREKILSGRLTEGTPLREIELAEQFGVSRGPVREALQQLVHEGVLVGEPNRGVRVAPVAPDSIRELVVPIRRTIETFALRSFFSQINENDYVVWEEILGHLKTACEKRDYAAIAEHDIALHRSLLNRAGQADLLAIWSVLVARVRHHFWQNRLVYNDPMDIYAEHRALIDAFQSANLETAVKALEENIA